MNIRNSILTVAATLVMAFATASTVAARQQDHSSSTSWQCDNILADPQGHPGSSVAYCQNVWVHAPLFANVYPGYYPSNGYGYGGPEASCAARFRSYNPATRTYIGHDGRPHHCP
jgi:hypothetical protein